ncbi:hypothetical protein [Nonomuraea dietziae]
MHPCRSWFAVTEARDSIAGEDWTGSTARWHAEQWVLPDGNKTIMFPR